MASCSKMLKNAVSFFISNILFFIGGQVIQALGEKVFGLSADGQLNRAIKFVDQFMSAEFLVE